MFIIIYIYYTTLFQHFPILHLWYIFTQNLYLSLTTTGSHADHTNLNHNKTDVQMNDSISNAASDDFQLEIDTELTKTDDTTSDTINTSHGSPTSAAEIQSSSTGDNLYDFIEERLLSLNPEMTMALGSLTYHTDFHPHYFPPEKEGAFRKTLYKKTLTGGKDEADKLGLVFIGEICSLVYGTAISAKGNHYVRSTKNPNVHSTQIGLPSVVL